MKIIYFSFALLAPLLVLVASGCNSGSADGLVPVTGTVTLDDKPLANAVLTFIPSGETLGQGGVARTDAAGKFEATSFDLKDKGLVQGNYRVVITKPVNPDGTDFVAAPDTDMMTATYKQLLPPIYSDQTQTKLTAEIPAAGKELEFKLSSKAR